MRRCFLIGWLILALLAFHAITPVAAQNNPPTYQVVNTSGIDQFDSNVSINDNGYVTFIGTSGGKQNIYVSKPPYTTSYALMSKDYELPTTGAAPTQTFTAPQINNSNQVISRRYLTGKIDIYVLQLPLLYPSLLSYDNAPFTYIESWNADKAASPTATQLAVGDPDLTYTVNGINTPLTLVQGVIWHPNWTDTFPSPFVPYSFTGGPLIFLFQYLPPFPIWQAYFSPVTMNDSGQAAFFTLKDDARDHSTDGNYLATSASTVAQSHQTTEDINSQQPRIANDGSIIFYEGDAIKLTSYGLGSSQSVSSGVSGVGKKPGISKDGKLIAFSGIAGGVQGVFIRYPTSAGYQIFPVAYVGAGNDSSPQGAFQSFSAGDSVNVTNNGTVVFIATSKDGKQGVFFSRVFGSIGTTVIASAPAPIVKQGDSHEGLPANIQSFALFDSVNNKGQVAFWTQGADGPQIVVGNGFISGDGPDKTLGNPYDNPGGVAVSEPINVGTGNVYDEIIDYQTAGANKLQFVRYYNSLAKLDSVSVSLGRNWRSNYDRYLTRLSATTMAAIGADGRGLLFTLNGSNWVGDSDTGMKLTQSSTTWTLTDADDTVETYSVNGNSSQIVLTSIQARNGYTQTLSYGANSQIASVTDSYNRTLSFTYQNGLLQTVTTPDGLVLTYGYDSSSGNLANPDRLRSIAYSTTPQTSQTYLYENPALPFALTGTIDENGNRFATWTYDSFGRGLSSQLGAGAFLTRVAYNDNDGSRTVTNPLGQQTIYHFTILQKVPKVTEIDRVATATTAAANKTIAYDANGYEASESDWNGNITTYVNDILGRPTTIVEATGTPEERATRISYFLDYHLPAQIIAPKLTSAFTYDASGNLLTKTLTDTTTTTIPYVTAGQTRTWMYTWVNGLLTSVKNPRQDVNALTTFAYDASGTLTKTTNALGQTLRVTQHTPGGLPLVIADANGVTTTLRYDARLRLAGSTVSTTAGPLTTQYGYDPAGNLLMVTLPDGSAIANSYDIAHRLIGVTDLFRQTIGYTLNAAGERTQITIANAGGAIQRQRSNTFDALARLTQYTGGAAQKTQYAYDDNGNLVTLTDPLSRSQTQAFDALNRVAQITDAGQGVITPSYDPQDRPQSVAAPNGATTAYIYDGFGDVIERISPDSGITVYTYDADGNLTQKVDATGTVTNYSYDALDRVKTTTYPANVGENVTYIYDQAGHGAGIGRLTTLTDAAGTLARSYDERGNLLQEIRAGSGTTLTTAYAYDAASRVAGIMYPSGWIVSYLRDAMGRATSVIVKDPNTGTAQTVVTNIGYKPFGPVSSLTFGNGIVEMRNFDNDYRLTSLTTNGSRALQSLNYGYDAADNVLSITDGVTPQYSQAFGYDALNRLDSATGGYGSLAYTYDSVGNRLTQMQGVALTTYAYAPQSNRLSTLTSGGVTQTVGYTAAGNISATGSAANIAMTYNQAGRLAAISQAGTKKGNVRYVYDAFGQRFAKIPAAQGQTLYQYDQQGRMLEEKGFTASAVADYIYLDDGRLIATISPSARAIYFLHCDRLGTPQLATNNTQNVVWSTAYMPFGQTGTVNGATTQNLRLPGQYFDVETGWNQNGFRDYVPTLGRYLESDPVGLGGGINTYAYATDSPLCMIDLRGLDVKVYSMGLHEAVSIDTSNGTESFGFGPSNTALETLSFVPVPGRIDNGPGANKYSDTSNGTLMSSYDLDKLTGDEVVAALRRLQANPPYYNFMGFNCNQFANMVASYAKFGTFSAGSVSPLDTNFLIPNAF